MVRAMYEYFPLIQKMKQKQQPASQNESRLLHKVKNLQAYA